MPPDGRRYRPGASGGSPPPISAPGSGARPAGPAVAVAIEADRPHVAQELLSEAAELAEALDGHVVALAEPAEADAARLGAWGADEVVALIGPPDAALVPEDIAGAVAEWAGNVGPWAVLAPSTAWGREVAARAAARLGAGLTGDAVGFDVDWGASPASPEAPDPRLVAWKPAFGGQVV